MCSVVGYCGSRSAVDKVLEGLGRLEYRGYDSAGCAFFDEQHNGPQIIKTVGGVEPLRMKCQNHPSLGSGSVRPTVALGHTRWSTHGAVSELNAHPHTDCTRKAAVVHNGTIENYHILKDRLLAQGHHIVSEGDTELIAHILEELVERGLSIPETIVALVSQLEGAYGLILMHQAWPSVLVAVRKSSPLCIGLGANGSYIASDTLAFALNARQVIYLPDESFALVTADSCMVYDFAGNERTVPVQHLAHTVTDDAKGGHEHYMHKEIFQQPRVIADTVNFMRRTGDTLFSHIGLCAQQLRKIHSVSLIGCGTSYHAAALADIFFQEIAALPASCHIASEFRHRPLFIGENHLPICISQSGETADTLEALRLIRATGVHTIALVNVASSTMVREADGFVLTQAGYEMAVASTKAFTAQLAALYWLAHWVAVQRGTLPLSALSRAEEELAGVGQALDESMTHYEAELADTVAPIYAGYRTAMFLGRHISYPFALEAALKLKEVAYCTVQGYPAGELKHGALALVDGQTPVFIFSCLDESVYRKLCVNAQEVKARGGHIVAWLFQGQHELTALADRVFVFPQVAPLLAPLVMTGVMQLFVYHVARALNRPIDRPRNLAKSVTVE